MNASGSPERMEVLGVDISIINLDLARAAILNALQTHTKGYVCVTGVHGIMEAQRDDSFRKILNDSFLCTPDGMPMVWINKVRGFSQIDRVYGPDLMLEICEATRNTEFTHFLYGGAPGTVEQLEAALVERFPGLKIAGTYTPPFRPLTAEEEGDLRTRFERLRPSITWIGLSTPKQEKFMAEYLPKLDTTLMFGVGAAFDFHSGKVRQAPRFIQRSGLEWLYRVIQEPRRLWRRYLTNNTSFLWLLVLDRFKGGRKRIGSGGRDTLRPLRVAFLGSRGVPARYSGFEVVVEELGARLAEKGYATTVYNRFPNSPASAQTYRGMRVITLPTIPSKSLDTIVHTFLSALHAISQRYDLIYLCGVGNAVIGGFLRCCGMKVIINVDGADFRRAKWGSFARFWLRMSERWATRMADAVIADNREIVTRYQKEYKTTPLYLSYGCIIRDQPVAVGELAKWGLRPREYILFVSRLSPENEAQLLLEAFALCSTDCKLVICGGANYEQAHFRELQKLAGDRVIFTGARYGDSYLELSQNALFFVMPACIEATRLVLLDQMGLGSAILYKECAATSEVVGAAGESFAAEDAVHALAAKLTELCADPARCEELGRLAQARARELYDWRRVVDQYETLFAQLGIRAAEKAAS